MKPPQSPGPPHRTQAISDAGGEARAFTVLLERSPPRAPTFPCQFRTASRRRFIKFSLQLRHGIALALGGGYFVQA
jgi:hypothetical protein